MPHPTTFIGIAAVLAMSFAAPQQDDPFVEAFEAAWRDPAHRFEALFHADGTLLQSSMEKPVGRAGVAAQVAAILQRFPDLRIEVRHWARNGHVILIEWAASGRPYGKGDVVRWQGASRFTLRDGLILEEIAYFDTTFLRALEVGVTDAVRAR